MADRVQRGNNGELEQALHQIQQAQQGQNARTNNTNAGGQTRGVQRAQQRVQNNTTQTTLNRAGENRQNQTLARQGIGLHINRQA